MICCLFGHRDTPGSVRPRLLLTLSELVEQRDVHEFMVGNQGGFDRLAQSVLQNLQQKYPQVSCYTVLAYVPGRKAEYESATLLPTLLPEGVENVPPRYAISWRNKWLARQADVVVAYVVSSYGGAAQAVAYARRQGKEIINIAEVKDHSND